MVEKELKGLISKGLIRNTYPATTRLNVFSWSIVNSNSDSEHRVHIFVLWELPEFIWKSTENLPEIAHEQLGGGVLHPIPPVATSLTAELTWTPCLLSEITIKPFSGGCRSADILQFI